MAYEALMAIPAQLRPSTKDKTMGQDLTPRVYKAGQEAGRLEIAREALVKALTEPSYPLDGGSFTAEGGRFVLNALAAAWAIDFRPAVVKDGDAQELVLAIDLIGERRGYRTALCSLFMDQHHQVFSAPEDVMEGEPLWSSAKQRSCQRIVNFMVASLLDSDFLTPTWVDPRAAAAP